MAVTPTTAGQAGTAAVRAHLGRIREVEKASGPAAAETELVALMREGVQAPQAFMALTRLLAKQKKLEDALRAAAKARSLAPLDAEPLVALGLINLRLERTEAAAQSFADAIRLEPGNARAHVGAAAVKLAAEDYDDALAICERALALDPELDRARELSARIKQKMGRPDEAIATLRGLVEKNPGNSRAVRAFVRLSRQENRSDEALGLLEGQVRARPDDRRAVNRLARAAAASGRADLAVAQYERLAGDEGARLSDRVRHVMALIEAGDAGRAREAMAQLGGQRAMKPVLQKLEGDIMLKDGDPVRAVAEYQAACRDARLDPLDAAAAEGAADDAARAKLWRAHAQKSIIAAVRGRRAGAE